MAMRDTSNSHSLAVYNSTCDFASEKWAKLFKFSLLNKFTIDELAQAIIWSFIDSE